MQRLLIEIIVIILVSLFAFVLGAIIGSGKRRNDEQEALLESQANKYRTASIEKAQTVY
jgi:hypothetical protein